ncbi:hypothetical protein BDR07DRAFT_1448299 [Suillus spraguei]|nr:hypothetical protein BDR07DRAFT_1448299 [Suillus spraguei]
MSPTSSSHIPLHARCPASENLLCVFTASCVGSLSGTTVHNHMTPLKAWHAYLDKPWQGSVRLNYMSNGVSHLAPSSSRRPPWPPITRAMLLLLASKLDSTNSFDICCLVAATCATWGQLCEDVILCHQRDASDPICALERHLEVNCSDINLPLFCFYSSSGLRCLTRKNFLARCNSIWASSGLATSSGHSFRIGGTTEFLLAGVPPDVVKALGHWSSNSFFRYWHSLELLAPLHVENI